MPFGESFQSTIRSNKAIMLDKTKRFRKTSGSFNWLKSGQFDFPKASPEQLELIKRKIQLENRRDRIKQILLLTISMLLLILILIFFI